MSNITQLPVIAGVEIPVDEHGRFNLNALHKASGLGEHKRPSKWLEGQQAQELIQEFISQSPNLGFGPIDIKRGGNSPGTFAHEILAVEYAGWISPTFRIKVNQTFIDYRTGNLAPIKEFTRLELAQMILESEQEKERLALENAEMKPKAEFHDKVAVAPDAISISEAAKLLGTGRRRLFAFLRQVGWVTRKNEPYQAKIEQGYLDVKLGSWEHPDHGLQQSVTPLVTGKGLTRLQKIYGRENVL